MPTYFELQNNPILTTPSAITGPKITSIGYPGNDTAADTAGGQTITLTGQGFEAGASVIINNAAVGVVSVVSSTTITFTSPALSTGSYPVYVVNTDGGTAIAVPGIQYSGTPTWTTAAGSLGSYTETQAISNTVTATGDAPISYSLFSGTLPTGASLNSANGLISGTSPLSASPTTYTFTIRATDAQQQDTNRSFSLTINPDVVTWSSPANGTTYTSVVNSAISNVALSATAASGQSVSYTANALPTGLSISGSNITGTPTVVANSSTLLTATAATTNATATRTINWVISVASDPDFEYVTTLLSASNPSSTFVTDASTNNFAVSVFGDTRPNNFGPYTPGYYSGYFDGNGDYLTTASNSWTQLSTGNFTIESWVYITSYGSYFPVVDARASAGTVPWLFGVNGSGFADFYGGPTMTRLTDNVAVGLNIWVHLAAVRNGSTVTLYVNGVSKATTTFSSAINGGSSTPWIGGMLDPLYANGYISNLRVVIGSAVYTAAFTPSTTPLTAIANTSILTCQSNRFIDNSTNNFTITRVGDTSISGFDPFAPNSSYSSYGSGYFDGTGDYITLPASQTNLQPGSGNFTIEFWYYTTTTPSGYINLFSYGASGNVLRLFLYTTNSLMVWTGATPIITANNAHVASAWNHVAIVRSGTTVTLYVNGVSVGTNTSNSTNYVGDLSIAYESAQTPLTGYITDFRLVKGTAVYTTAFTPPASPLTAIANTSLLTLQNNQPNNNSMFLDSSANNFLITRAGNTTQGSFTPYGGGWSNYFDGNNDWLSIPTNDLVNLGSSDFTIEAWIYITSTTGYNYAMVVNKDQASGGSYEPTWRAWKLQINYSGGVYNTMSLVLFSGSTIDTITTTGVSFSLNTWYHVAAVRNSGTIKLYVNGTSYASVANTASLNSTSYPVRIGADGYGVSSSDPNKGYFPGYISNVRVVKGTAVYTGNFTPPTAPLTAIPNTGLLTCADNRFVDDSAFNGTVTVNETVRIQRFNPFNPVLTTPTGYSGYFDGIGDYLSVPANTAFVMGTGDFTAEAWIYPTATPVSANGGIISNGGDSNQSANQTFIISLTTTNTISIYLGTSVSGTSITTSTTVSLNTWNHIAVTRSGNNFTIWLNGVSAATGTNSVNLSASTTVLIGRQYTDIDGRYFTGYISNLRVVKGTAVYTSNFTPSTTPLTAIANTSLLTLQNATFRDNSTNNFTITANGDSAPRQFNPFGWTTTTGSAAAYSATNYGGSMYFDGSGDNLLVNNSLAALGSSDNWTVECWIYPTVTAEGVIWFNGTSGSDSNRIQLMRRSVNYIEAYGTGPSGNFGPIFTENNTVAFNAWNHVALVKNSTSIKIYLNGVNKGGSWSGGVSGTLPTVNTFYIGYGRASGGDTNFGGYISNLRSVKGQALYTSNFVPPAAPVSFNANAVLQVNGTSAAIYDSAMITTYETVADARSTGVIKKYGNSSIAFDGTGDALYAPWVPSLELGAGSFTIEFWAYIAGGNSLYCWSVDWHYGMTFNYGGANANRVGIWASSNGSSWNIFNADGGGNGISTGTITLNTWTHVALVRNGSSWTLYLNGTSAWTGTSSATIVTRSTDIFRIGGPWPGAGPTNLNGYIDDFRITPGVARYTSNFTPPTTPFIGN
jgi:hypothetical protein